MNISIIGCGWLGTPLAKILIQDGHQIRGTTQTESKINDLKAQGIEVHLLTPVASPSPVLLNSDLIILNLPPIDGFISWLSTWAWNPKTKIIFTSSTSVYQGSGNIDETTMTSGKLSEIEKWIQTAFENWTILRLGGLIGYDRHPGKVLSGRKDLNGKNHPVNLIHRDDVIGLILTLMKLNIHNEIINVVSDEHSKRSEFYIEYCLRKNLALPEFNEDDLSEGKLISNSKMSALYQLKFSRMIGKEL